MSHKFERIKPELEIEEYARAHNRGFKIQKAGLFIIFTIVVLAAFGLFGDGVLSARTQTSRSATVEFERFYRFEAIMEVKVELLAFENSNVVSFPKDYLKEFEIKSITPSPETTNFKGDRSQFVFNGPGNGIITFFLEPRTIGNIRGDLTVNGERFNLDHFIYP